MELAQIAELILGAVATVGMAYGGIYSARTAPTTDREEQD
jgi:hypothetical protein